MIFGKELLLDLYDCLPGTTDNIDLAYQFLEDAVKVLGVTKMAPPYVFRAPEGYANSGGVSGWVPIIESGIQIHAMSEKNFVSIDFYTCSNLDEKMQLKLIDLAVNTFESTKIESQLIERGKDYAN